ncbi:hypothetical protein CDL12_14622 [Handroanthus impetiginosus]|uniref:Uncharacterized protein n=1 Tax=Handroanthus impetiginosus TaxID=429701 RepID=A0A2G9H5G8_9LAMI|nr:hypothetical protein CDL12_14622 [Handroanthus impetiginosus]
MGSLITHWGYCRKILQKTIGRMVLSSHSDSIIRVRYGNGRMGTWHINQEFIQRTQYEHTWDSWDHNLRNRHTSAICLQPDEDNVRRKYWVIYHHVLGYALIVLIIANIFEGITNQSAAKRWEWAYGVILGVLGVTAIALEVLRRNLN